jgi:hypothetical protein
MQRVWHIMSAAMMLVMIGFGGMAHAFQSQPPAKSPPAKTTPVKSPPAKPTPPKNQPAKPPVKAPPATTPITLEPEAQAAANWRTVATDADRKRIRSWWKSWDDALKSARAAGFGKQIAAEGSLLKPDAALPNPFIAPGDYKCRVIKLGTPNTGSGLAFVDYPFFKCRIAAEQAIFSLTKLTGSQRPVGLLFDDTEKRQIFLGTLVLGDETSPLDYATDSKRDMAGMVERIAPRRWRLVLPYPAYESLLDVIEILPETP